MIAELRRGQSVPILAALLLGTLMTSMSQLIVITALPVVVADLGGLELYGWGFASAMLTSTIVGPIAGKLSDIYGRKTLYLTGMGIFMLGSVLSGLSQTFPQLVAFRAIQGVGQGCVFPVVSALLADLFAPDKRARWQGINGSIWALSSGIGPVIGGYLAEQVSWRWVFYVNLGPGLLAVLLMVWFFPARARSLSRPPIDYHGIALFTAALMPLLLTTVWGGQAFPWASPQTLALLGLSALMLVAFVRREQVAPEPIVPLGLFRNRTFQTVVVLLLLSGIGMFAATTYAPLYLQGVLGISPKDSGLLFAPAVVLSSITSVVAGIYLPRIGFRRLTFMTMGSAAAGFLLMTLMGSQANALTVVIALSVIASGIGMSFPVFIIAAQSAVDRSVMGIVSSLVQFTRSLGGILGITVLGAYLSSRLFDAVGISAAGREIVGLLQPATLAAMSAADAALLRAELADALHVVFFAGAIVMAIATLFVTRLEDMPLKGWGRRVEQNTEPESVAGVAGTVG